MYGTEVSTTGVLAATGLGLATGAWIMSGAVLVLAGIALYLLFRKESKIKP